MEKVQNVHLRDAKTEKFPLIQFLNSKLKFIQNIDGVRFAYAPFLGKAKLSQTRANVYHSSGTDQKEEGTEFLMMEEFSTSLNYSRLTKTPAKICEREQTVVFIRMFHIRRISAFCRYVPDAVWVEICDTRR